LRQQRLLKRCKGAAMKAYLEAELPDLRQDFRRARYLAVDLEMTGMDALSDHILSIGFVPVDDLRVVLNGASHRLVSSDMGVGQSAVIHGIHDRDIDGAGNLREAMDALLKALQGRVMLLHCASLDMAFLQQACQNLYGVPLLVPVVDTMALEDQRLQRNSSGQHGQSLRLSESRRRYNLPDYRAHNALVDAVSTAELFLAQVSHRFGKHPGSLRQLPAQFA
jgi:DNA polymerase-3 subunit epsilon